MCWLSDSMRKEVNTIVGIVPCFTLNGYNVLWSHFSCHMCVENNDYTLFDSVGLWSVQGPARLFQSAPPP